MGETQRNAVASSSQRFVVESVSVSAVISATGVVIEMGNRVTVGQKVSKCIDKERELSVKSWVMHGWKMKQVSSTAGPLHRELMYTTRA
jgi:hypothetical protein